VRDLAADDQREHQKQCQCNRVGHQHHTQRGHPARCDTADEIADAVAQRRSQREDDPDQVLPFMRLPISRATSRWASRLAMS
jgi:hypothetical protein